MNIAIISTKLNDGGAERIAGLLSKELSKYYNVYLFLTSTENIVYEYGGTIVDIGRSGFFYEYPIKKYKDKYKIDVAISFMEIMNFANIRTKGSEQVIISERSVQSLVEPPLASETYRIKRYYPYADAIVACSHGVKYDLEVNYDIKDNIEIIYNFVNQEQIKKKSLEKIPSEVCEFIGDSPYFLAVGRLHDQKNYRRLITQFNVFREKNKHYKLIIFGDGALKSELENYISLLEMEEAVKIFHYTNNPYVLIKNAKSLIVSSRYEGLPNIILEAMTVGCPIVSTDCMAGPRELLADIHEYKSELDQVFIGERGILVGNLDSEDTGETTYMAEAMNIVSSNQCLIDSIINAQADYMREYKNDMISDQWVKLIESNHRSSASYNYDENSFLKSNRNVFIYGAGMVGNTYFLRLKDKCKIMGFIVTSNQKEKKEHLGLPLYDLDDFPFDYEDSAFIIGVGDNYQDEVVRSLIDHGANYFAFPSIIPISYDYFIDGVYNIKEELCNWYKMITGMELDIEHPQTYNEKLQWLKIYDNKPIKKLLVDKISVRDYVSEKVGSKYLIPVLGVWNTYDDINFDRLPMRFALKCNNGSGTNIIVNDKNKMNHEVNRRKFNSWQNDKYEYMCGFELQYADIEPKIYAEELLESEDGSDLKDYKVFVFDGIAKLIQVDIGRHHEHRRNLYTPEWNYLPYSILYPTAATIKIEKPECLSEMITVAQILAEGFIHARVDFYISNGRLYFGEITFTHGSGIEKFSPPEFGIEMGNWMKLNK